MKDFHLRKIGLKVTIPRVKVLEILAEHEPHHMSAEAIYDALANDGVEVALATVYRVLTQFEQAGIVHRHAFDGSESAVFELSSGEHHDHLVCVSCGCVEEFVDNVIEKRQAKIAVERGYKMTDHSLVIYGQCPQCVSA